MHIIFLNPQGNFDKQDSFWTEHPDFGGQLVYVKELCIALANMGVQADIVTRVIKDPEWPGFAKEIDSYNEATGNLRIIRLPFGGPRFLNKERLWEHLDEYIDKVLSFYGNKMPDFVTAHYADGGYSAVLLKQKTGIGFTFTGHSLGAQKLDKLGMNLDNFSEMNRHYHFTKRITAERLSMMHAYNTITSTSQERLEQYAHPLYSGTADVNANAQFSVIPPGVNTKIFNTERNKGDEAFSHAISEKMYGNNKASIVVSNRLDEKKNTIGVVKAYAGSKRLQEKANLCLFVRGLDDPFLEIHKLHTEERHILKPILELIDQNNLRKNTFFFNVQSQKELAASYRHFAQLGSVFALTAFYEPFGLAPIEAAACGLSVVATKNGGPSEIFEDGSGILVDPFNDNNISKGLMEAIERFNHYSVLGMKRVKAKYTWAKTAEGYLSVIRKGLRKQYDKGFSLPELNDPERIKQYLSEKAPASK